MEQDNENQDIVQLVISTVNDMAGESGSPTFQGLIERLIKGYAVFAKSIIMANSKVEIARIVDEHMEAKELNDKIQQYIKLADRGLVTIQPAELIITYVRHPAIQEVSDEGSAACIREWMSDTVPDDFFDVVNRVVTGAAAAQILGGIKFWVDQDTLQPEQYALVHPLSSTKH